MTRYLSIYRGTESERPPTQEEMAAMGTFMDEAIKAGVLLSTEGCMPSRFGMKVRQTEGKITVTDGPFAEAKEVVGGFALMEFSSREDAIEWSRRFMELAGDGECEVRRLYEMPAFDGANPPVGSANA